MSLSQNYCEDQQTSTARRNNGGRSRRAARGGGGARDRAGGRKRRGGDEGDGKEESNDNSSVVRKNVRGFTNSEIKRCLVSSDGLLYCGIFSWGCHMLYDTPKSTRFDDSM